MRTIELDIPTDPAERIERERLARKDITREEFETLQHQLATTQRSLIRAHQEIVEIKADLMAAGIPKGGKSSKLILPDRMN